ncbi:MAG: CRISPR-associated protein Csh2 [Candidatus Argoarchaeum ethanivorans]|uniref:CRISPR-associated protein Csh2 n=1 Tax=Candidatus Argoarchaeum ethanivorans TaxID=2608793 RepID=A0A8B3S342_9EURY|nr:MAG: CRISPR-associated protein Csh2 [Candidatus Argoarchaeum ethanivorans]
MNSTIANRSELVFLYDLKDANPNGDPLDENKPRIDEETGINLVTDVRLKRTIRDYLYKFKKQEIFVREIETGEGHIQDAKLRAEDFLVRDGAKIGKSDLSISEMKNVIEENVLAKCIDVRLFGLTLPIEKDPITHTGPVQFKMGRSLHRVFTKHFKGTGAFASNKGAKQKTFREEDFLPYSLICFYGIINENAAKETKLTEDDVGLLLDGVWNGTKNLISRSKAGQVPRLLLKVNYSENNYHIGDLNNMLKLSLDVPEDEIRDISQVKLDVTELMNALGTNKGMIQDIDYRIDDRVKVLCNKEDKTFEECLETVGIVTNVILV